MTTQFSSNSNHRGTRLKEYSLQNIGYLKQTSIRADAETIPKYTTQDFLGDTGTGKRKTFKAYKRYFAKDIRNLIRKNARKENKNVGELTKTQRSTTADEEGISCGVDEQRKTNDQV